MSEARTIASAANPRYKRWKRLAEDRQVRRAERATLLEGAHLLDAALLAGCALRALLLPEAEAADAETERLLGRARADVARYRLAQKLFAGLTELAAPTGVIAEVAIPEPRSDAYFTVVLLDRIQDPGNVGALLRTAAAAGVEAVYASQGCADLWSPRVLRAGMGAHFRLAVWEQADLAAIAAAIAGTVCCTAPTGASIYDADLRGRTAWVFGNEGSGVTPELASLCTRRLAIPTSGRVESLNVAAAAAVCLFEQRRQRLEAGVLTSGS